MIIFFIQDVAYVFAYIYAKFCVCVIILNIFRIISYIGGSEKNLSALTRECKLFLQCIIYIKYYMNKDIKYH